MAVQAVRSVQVVQAVRTQDLWNPMMEAKLWFDGGCKPTNPGPAYGSYRIHLKVRPDHMLKYQQSRFKILDRPIGNNEAEYRALIRGLSDTVVQAVPALDVAISIFTDSNLVFNQVSGNWAPKADHIKSVCAEVKQLLSGFGFWQIFWHPRSHNVSMFGH